MHRLGERHPRQREEQVHTHVWGNKKEACVAGAELSCEQPSRACYRGKELGFGCKLHGKPQALLKLKGDVVSFTSCRLAGCCGGSDRRSPKLPPSCQGQVMSSSLPCMVSECTGWLWPPGPQSCPHSLKSSSSPPVPCMLYGTCSHHSSTLAASGPP